MITGKTREERIQDLYIDATVDDVAPNVFAKELLDLVTDLILDDYNDYVNMMYQETGLNEDDIHKFKEWLLH